MFDVPKYSPPACDGSRGFTPKRSKAERITENAQKRAAVDAMKKEAEKKARPRKPIGARLRAMVLERDGFRCKRCGRGACDGEQMRIDHIVPIAQGGTNDESNLQVLCETCNLGKGARREPIDNSKIVSQLAAIVGKKGKKNKERAA